MLSEEIDRDDAVKRISYDMSILQILKETNGGRCKITSDILNCILNFSQEFQLLNQVPNIRKESLKAHMHEYKSKPKPFELVILKLCDGSQVFNKMTEKLSIHRYAEDRLVKAELFDLFEEMVA